MIDDDGDGEYDFIYDPAAEKLISLKEEEKETRELPLIIVGMIFIFVVIGLIVFIVVIYKKK